MFFTAQIDWPRIFSGENITTAIRIAALIVIGFPLLLILVSASGKAMKKRLSAQGNMLLRKGIFYAGSLFIILAVIYQLGYRLTAFLGAAGIAGIAIGFASQTSISNIISGLFLISERPFEVGDIIQVGDTRGMVLSIDLLSVKLRTFDNQFVRMPNETLIKTEVKNFTHFPIRRLDINISVAYKEDVCRVEDILFDIAANNPFCLDEPEPIVRFTNFGDSALEFLFALWCVKDDYIKLRNKVMKEIKERFDTEGIEIPFPHRTLYTGSMTEPFPVRVINENEKKIDSNKAE